MKLKSFGDIEGKASLGVDRLKLVNGVNRFRIVGAVRPMYKYWVKTKDGMSVPMECLSFNIEKEAFDNAEHDYVKELLKGVQDVKAQWSYCSLVIDRTDGKIKIFDHKKKLFQSIVKCGKKLGDPTDPEKGWDIVVEREKTGPLAYNVEYTLDPLACSETVGPLTDEEKEMIKETSDILSLVPRKTPEDQKEFIETYILGDGNSAAESGAEAGTDETDEDLDELDT